MLLFFLIKHYLTFNLINNLETIENNRELPLPYITLTAAMYSPMPLHFGKRFDYFTRLTGFFIFAHIVYHYADALSSETTMLNAF